MNEFWKGVSSAVIAAGIIGIAGYLLIVKENQTKIEALTKSIDGLKESADETQKSLNTTRLFVAQAHPNRKLSQADSLKKLQALNMNEMVLLAEGLPELEVSGENTVKIVPASIRGLAAKYDFSEKDLVVFHAVAQPIKKKIMGRRF